MHNIKTEVVINAPKEIVFQVLKDMHSYPEFMRYVRNVDIRMISDEEIISKWTIDIEGADVEWEERDVFNKKKMEMFFTMLKGDYGNYYGKWAINNMSKKSALSLDVYVDWHIPSFETVIGPILERKTKRIIRGMLTAIKLRSQKIYNERTEK